MILNPRTSAIVVILVAIISAVWVLFVAPPPPFPHSFQVELSPKVETVARLHYQRGAGWRESESAAQALQPSDWFETVRLPLPPGKFREFRFSPLSAAGRVWVRNARVVTFDGRTVREIEPRELVVGRGVAAQFENDGMLALATTEASEEAQLSLKFDPVLRLSLGFWSTFKLQFPRWAKLTFGALAAIVVATAIWQNRRRLRKASVPQLRDRSPFRSLAVVAACSAALASYPVVFFQKSFLSPANGALMLYDRSPTVPGDYDLRPEEGYGSDLGAMHWAHLPYTVITRRAVLEDGELPLWNRYNSTGVTLIGQGQAMIADPLQWIVTAVGSESWAFDIKYVLCKALFGLGLGWCVWLLTRDLKAAALVVFAAVFVAFYNFRANHPAIFSLSYSPWVLVAWLHILQSRSSRAFTASMAGWFLANWMLINSGTVKEAYLLCGALNVSGLGIFLLSPEPWRSKLRRGLMLIALAVAFFLISAPLWSSLLSAMRTAATFYDAPVAYQHRSDWLIGLFDDLFLRELNLNHWVVTPAANFLILLGCLCALLQPHRLIRDRAALVLLAGLLLSAGIAFNWIPPGWIVRVPFLKSAHHVHNHFSCIAIVHAAVLAGWGFSAARRPLASRYWGWFASAVAAVILLLLARYFLNDVRPWTGGNGFAGWRERLPIQWFFYTQIVLLVLALMTLLVVASRKLRGRRIGILLATATAISLLAITVRHGQHLPFDAPAGFFRFPGARADLLRSSPATEYLAREVSLEPGRVVGIVNTLFTGFTAVYGLEGTNGPDAIFNPHYRELLLAAKLPAPNDWRFAVWPHLLRDVTPVLDFFNVRYVGALPGMPLNLDQHHHVVALDLDIYQSDTAWPRAFFTDQLDSYTDAAGLIARVNARPTAPFAAVQVGDTAAPAANPGSGNPAAASAATDYRLTTNSTSFTINARRPGFAVLHEAWLPDEFIAELNGEVVPYFRVNHAFKAIAIPETGSHRVSFRYRPPHLTLALWLSAAGLTIFTALCCVSLRYSFPRRQAACPE